jgi:hypothetical protein
MRSVARVSAVAAERVDCRNANHRFARFAVDTMVQHSPMIRVGRWYFGTFGERKRRSDSADGPVYFWEVIARSELLLTVVRFSPGRGWVLT